ncbi:SPOR domain-containing protein [Alcanivorax sp. 1008]|uniref:SPOR domain-containing protein n=1 Tax=Alcanivorax sp. 1008 TaxID=2816853 RepID=UPI001D20216A|nr:SPOR domain-containing protein [Alcanivorax sp. 1008]MCC1495669.1 SPOR domain-containing protein [Alcanivorax sp. 1008]
MALIRCAILVLCALSSVAVAELVVEGLQYPAWVQKNGTNIALAPGDTIFSGEQIITGAGGKVWLKMPDHARVKVGPEATLNVGLMTVSSTGNEDTENSLQGALEVVRGAFRYTTTELSKLWRRDVNLQLGNTATIGIRGTDLWGQVDSNDQFVVLIEGRITVKPRDITEAITLMNPLQTYRAGRQEAGSVDMQALQSLAPITELDAGSGIMRQGGEYSLNLASFSSSDQAKLFAQVLDKAGLASTTTRVNIADAVWWRVSAVALVSLQDARSLRERLSGFQQVSSPWISK